MGRGPVLRWFTHDCSGQQEGKHNGKEKHRFNPGAILGTALLVEATGQIEPHSSNMTHHTQSFFTGKTFYYKL